MGNINGHPNFPNDIMYIFCILYVFGHPGLLSCAAFHFQPIKMNSLAKFHCDCMKVPKDDAPVLTKSLYGLGFSLTSNHVKDLSPVP